MFREPWVDFIPPHHILSSTSISVDLGCGRFPRNPLSAGLLIGIDLFDKEPGLTNTKFKYIQVKPGDSIQVEDSSVDCVSAFDFLEHVPRFDRNSRGDATNPFIEIMNEVHRLLKPGALFIAITPCFPSPAAFGDPTHVNFISEGTFEYFAKHNFTKTLGYGFKGEFDVVCVKRVGAKGVLWDSGINSEQESGSGSSMLMKFKHRLGGIRHTIRYGFDEKTHQLWVLRKTESQ